VRGTRDRRARHVSGYCGLKEITTGFAAIEKEHARRTSAKKQSHRFDLSLKGRKVAVHLSAFATLALNEAGRLRETQLLHNQHASYFAQNPKTWRELDEARENGLITLSPTLVDEAEKALSESTRSAARRARPGLATSLGKSIHSPPARRSPQRPSSAPWRTATASRS
jgi:hypothetical protein